MNKKVDLLCLKKLPTERTGHFSSEAPTKNETIKDDNDDEKAAVIRQKHPDLNNRKQ